MMPALARGLQFVYIGINFSSWPNVDIMTPLYAGQVIILGMIFFAAWKFGTLHHPATYLAVAVNVFTLFLEPIGRSRSVEAFIRALIKV